MKKVLIFGTGSTGRRVYEEVKELYQVLGFLDNDAAKWNGYIDGISIIGNADSIAEMEYDEILICSLPAMQTIKNQLISVGVPANKINMDYVSTQINARVNFIRDFAALHQEIAKQYAVAEGGVFQGEFAREINSCFPDSTLYLFDTFDGFDDRDIKTEHQEGYSVLGEKHMGNTSVGVVMEKLLHKNKVVIRKGYFPETAKGLDDLTFFFVNLDFDLYNPTLEGLRFFYPKLSVGGLILIHDYYNPGYLGVKKAIEDFEKEMGISLVRLPIGDHCSIAILK